MAVSSSKAKSVCTFWREVCEHGLGISLSEAFLK